MLGATPGAPAFGPTEPFPLGECWVAAILFPVGVACLFFFITTLLLGGVTENFLFFIMLGRFDLLGCSSGDAPMLLSTGSPAAASAPDDAFSTGSSVSVSPGQVLRGRDYLLVGGVPRLLVQGACQVSDDG